MKNLFKLFPIAAVAVSSFFFMGCPPDACKKITCANNGTCLDGICSCTAGYEGELCATESRTKFLGTNNAPATYTGVETCGTGTDNYSIILSPSTAAADKVVITNLYNNSTSPYVITASVKSGKLELASTAVGSATITNLSGSLSGSSLSITYTIGNGTISNTCTFVGTKQ